MAASVTSWDYLIVTASHEDQARAYEQQLQLRQKLGLLGGVEQVLVLPDPGGRRVGSGGSTLFCLMDVLRREFADQPAKLQDPSAWLELLRRRRILIVHAGGDSKRLPAYGPCGKLFVPIPAHSDSALPATLFDRQIKTYLSLPAVEHAGQTVITSGDALLEFDPTDVVFHPSGITGLGSPAMPADAAKHGVFCTDAEGAVRHFLQKPTEEEQQRIGAVDRYGQSILDIGVMSFDAATAVRLLEAFQVVRQGDALAWSGRMGSAIEASGLDFYQEISCALGGETTADQYITAVGSRSRWAGDLLAQLYEKLRGIDFHLQVLRRCEFLHFGTTKQILRSGRELLYIDRGVTNPHAPLEINSAVTETGSISGTNAWIEACAVSADLELGGGNVLVGLDVDEPLSLPAGACLDVVPGCDREGKSVCFLRCYGVEDQFKDAAGAGATFCNHDVMKWIAAAGLSPEDVWDATIPETKRTVWDAKLFPAVADATHYRDWLWMYEPDSATAEQKKAYWLKDRYSLSEIGPLTSQDEFYTRRMQLHARNIFQSLRSMFRLESGFSAADLAQVLVALNQFDMQAKLIVGILREAQWHYGHDNGSRNGASFAFSRIIHTLGSALLMWQDNSRMCWRDLLPDISASLAAGERAFFDSIGLAIREDVLLRDWCVRAKSAAFEYMGKTILTSVDRLPSPPRSALRSDEIVWGRAPARLDLGGGWSDTPPYALEFGGCVINAAVTLNGQPPIHCYARVIETPVIRIGSIDLGTRVEITELEDLLNFRSATSEFALAKAALALTGFSPESANWNGCHHLPDMLKAFGGGIELTTLAAIPKGSGLGTSSIVGAVILGTVQRLMGRRLSHQDVFQGVLRLEQALTTGGGWQDQVGGVVDGCKVITTTPGLIPEARVHYVPSDILDPETNGGCSLLYYTGITRLAKNILQNVVGRYLDRNRLSCDTQRRIAALPRFVADAMARRDLPAFGKLIDTAWRLNKQIDPDSTNPEVERLLARVQPHIYGAKLLGAGGGGFLLMLCRSAQHAETIRQMLTAEPPNDRARFFDFSVNRKGLVVTVC